MSSGDLRLDGESTVDRSTCPDCGADYLLVKSFVLDDSGPYAIAFSALHWHGEAEAWIDVILGALKATPLMMTEPRSGAELDAWREVTNPPQRLCKQPFPTRTGRCSGAS